MTEKKIPGNSKPAEFTAIDKENDDEKEGLVSMATGCLGNTSAHGLPRLVADGHLARRVMWLLIFLGCFSGFTIQTYRTFRDYYSYPVAVTTTVKPTKKLVFPAVTVCNMNMLRSSLLTGTKYAKLKDLDTTFSDPKLWNSLDEKGDKEIDYSKILDPSFDPENPDTVKRRRRSLRKGREELSRNKRDYGPYDYGGGDYGGGSNNYGGGGTGAGGSYNYGGGNSYNYYDGGASGGSNYGNYEEGAPGEMPDYNVPFEFKDYGFSSIQDESAYDQFLAAAQTADLSDLSGVLKPTKSELTTLGHQANELILQCSFDKRPCNYTDFYTFNNAYYGNCYTFNHGQTGQKVISTTQYGSRYGLRLTLNVQSDEYIGMFSPTVGARITVHPHDQTPLPQDDGVDIMPGSETSVGLKVEEISRQEFPYPSNCTTGTWKGHKFEISSDNGNYTYSLLACRLTCFQKKVYERCGCYDKVVMDETDPRCSILNTTQERCRQKTKNSFDNFKLGCDCPQPCFERYYSKTVSAGVWPSGPYKNLLRRNIDKAIVENATGNLLRVHVYFEDRNVHIIKESPSFSDEQLAANIGGNLGLFIGISICTAVEFVEFIFDGVTYCCRKKFHKKNRVEEIKM